MNHFHKQGHQKHHVPDRITATTTAAVPPGHGSHNAPLVSAEDIRLCAYQKWESAGKPAGDGIQFWLKAEQELVPGK